MKFKSYFILFFMLLNIFIGYSQQTIITQRGVEFSVRIKVVDENNKSITNNVIVYVNSTPYRNANFKDEFIVKAQVDDQIRVTHPDFATVYHVLTSNEDIRIVVEDFSVNEYSSKKFTRGDTYKQFLDSAKFYKKQDIEKSVSFIEKALLTKGSKKQNATAYQLLADIYLYWKQYDLALYNYKLSHQIFKNVNVELAIANTQLLLKDYATSEATFKSVAKERLTNYQKIKVNEGLGDVLYAQKKWTDAKLYYKKALVLAKENLVTPKITDLNSKLADVFAAEGNINEAENQFRKTIDLAKKESARRALKEEEKVANFYNSNKSFDKEIDLRKKSLEKAKQQKLPVKTVEQDSITSQKINYKIGNAYLQKNDLKKAIPYLEESKKEAEKNNDIIVKKDATRKISEAFANLGDYNNALKNYREYVELVDSLYIRKEQEIQQVKRFSKRIAENQNRILSLEKDKELAESKIDLAYIDQKLSEESNRKQRILIYSLFGGLVLLSLLAYFMYRNNKQQKLANNLLALKSMRSQMNPHFIFNALNSVNSFIAVNDERNANRYLSEFSVLMRSVLENSDEDFISLTKEIELLELYVKLEHNRFKDKFDYKIQIDESINLEDFEIPPMLLQPYIENAIWHGLRYKKEKGNLEININKKDGDTIKISIIDNGIGRKHSQALKTKNQLKQKSKGMSTIKNRIAILNDMYKERISVNVTDVSKDGEGTKVELFLKK